MTTSKRFRFVAVALVGFVLSIPPVRAEDPAPASGTSAGSGWDGYFRIMPRFYDFVDDQGYLQRYRSLDAENEDGLDQAFAVLNEFAFDLTGSEAGAPMLEVVHSNPFILNDHWASRFRPGSGSRFELSFNEYQRPLEAFLPHAEPQTITYAQRYNDDRDLDQELYRRRQDVSLSAGVAPYVQSDGLSFLRDVEFDWRRSDRVGYRQFSWIFGVVEDLVVPAGNNPERWRGRTERIDQTIDRYALDTQMALGRGNATRLRIFSERFDNHAATVTNADIAAISSAINQAPRTINYIADYKLSGAEVAVEQSVGDRLTIFADGATQTLEQEGRTPLEAEAEYEGKIRTESLGLGVSYEATDALVVEASSGWSKRTNGTPVGTSSDTPRTYLVQDRNLSSPFLRELETTAFGGSISWYSKHLVARLGANQTDSEREFVRGVGSNAIPESMSVYRTDSNPLAIWGSLSGRVAKRLRWATRYEVREASRTWTVTDPEKAQRFRANVSYATPSGMLGASASFNWEDSTNDGFVLRGAASSAPLRMEVESTNFGLSVWWAAAATIQVYGGFQQISRDQEGNLVLTDIRRWRPQVLPRVADGDFGYESTVKVWNAGAAVTLGEKLVIVPAITFTDSEAGIRSIVAPVGDYTRIANQVLMFSLSSDYRLSPRSQVNLRYGFGEYDDEVAEALSGRLQEIGLGMTFSF